MSKFGVFIETIAKVSPHPNADRLEVAELEGIGYQFVIGKDMYKPGDKVLYFPIDAVLPVDVTNKLGLTGKLGGSAKNRVKTAKIRGVISQGIVGSVERFLSGAVASGMDYAPQLGVIKYEQEEIAPVGRSLGVKPQPLPDNVWKYDLENAERFKQAVELLMDEPVYITEKLEGSHIALTHYPDGHRLICSRNCLIGEYTVEGEVENGFHYYAGARNAKLHDVLDLLVKKEPGKQITIRGELLGPGIQGNIYKLTDYEVRLFEVEVNGQPLDADEFIKLNLGPVVPHIYSWGTLENWLHGRTLREASDGPSVLNANVLREGVVIKPMREKTHAALGRLVLKQRSPLYLASEK